MFVPRVYIALSIITELVLGLVKSIVQVVVNKDHLPKQSSVGNSGCLSSIAPKSNQAFR